MREERGARATALRVCRACADAAGERLRTDACVRGARGVAQAIGYRL